MRERTIKPQNWKISAKIAFSVIVLYFLFRKCDWPELFSTLKNANLLLVLLSFFVVQLTHAVAAFRWRLLCRKARFFPLFKLVYVSRLYSTVLPGQLFGEAAKVVYISQSNPEILPEEATASVVVDKIAGLIGLLLIGIGGVLFSSSMQSRDVLGWFAVCTLVLVLCVALPAFPPVSRLINRVLDAIKHRFPKAGGITERLRLFLTSWQSYLKTPLVLLLSVFAACVFQLLSTAGMSLLGHAVGVSVPLTDWCWIFAVLSVALLLPVSFAGLGVREATLVGFLGALGASRELALSASLLSLLIQVVDSLIGGAIVLFDPSMKRRAAITLKPDGSNPASGTSE
jgi:uncharacterized protein (TIRG00374 family)